MKKSILYSLIPAATLLLGACDSFDEMSNVKEIEPMDVSMNLNMAIENLASVTSLTAKFDNYTEDLHYVQALVEKGEPYTGGAELNTKFEDIIPGIYNVTILGTALDADGNEYYVTGALVNHAFHAGAPTLDLRISGLKVSPLIIKEVYYCGSRNPKGGNYFRDQFYEIYNNSAEVQYLDGIHFTNLTPTKATTTLPVFPESDGDYYCYADRIWKFPGTGTDYPLQPGESCVMAQFAAEHTLELYNPNSPVSCYDAEFEFNMNNPNFPDQPAFDMEHVFYDGKAAMGTTPQYLTSVFGGAYVLFRPDPSENWDPVNNPDLQTTDLSKPKSKTLYAKVPIKYVLDAVEAIDNESMIKAKRMPGVLDAGMTWVGATYIGKSVARKFQLDDEGNPVMRELPDGTQVHIYQDTNNSTEDFDRLIGEDDKPVMRRNGAKMPSWNHTLQKLN